MYLFYNKNTFIINGFGDNPINSETYSEFNPDIHNVYEGNFNIEDKNSPININIVVLENTNIFDCNIDGLNNIIISINNHICLNYDLDFINNKITINEIININDIINISANKKTIYKLINNKIQEI